MESTLTQQKPISFGKYDQAFASVWMWLCRVKLILSFLLFTWTQMACWSHYLGGLPRPGWVEELGWLTPRWGPLLIRWRELKVGHCRCSPLGAVFKLYGGSHPGWMAAGQQLCLGSASGSASEQPGHWAGCFLGCIWHKPDPHRHSSSSTSLATTLGSQLSFPREQPALAVPCHKFLGFTWRRRIQVCVMPQTLLVPHCPAWGDVSGRDFCCLSLHIIFLLVLAKQNLSLKMKQSK